MSQTVANGDVIHATPNDARRRRKGRAPAVPSQSTGDIYKTPPIINRVSSDVSSMQRPVTAPSRVNRQHSAATRINHAGYHRTDASPLTTSMLHHRTDESPLTTSMLQRQTTTDSNNNNDAVVGYMDPGVTVGSVSRTLLSKTKSVPELREKKDVKLIRRRSIVLVRTLTPYDVAPLSW